MDRQLAYLVEECVDNPREQEPYRTVIAVCSSMDNARQAIERAEKTNGRPMGMWVITAYEMDTDNTIWECVTKSDVNPSRD